MCMYTITLYCDQHCDLRSTISRPCGRVRSGNATQPSLAVPSPLQERGTLPHPPSNTHQLAPIFGSVDPTVQKLAASMEADEEASVSRVQTSGGPVPLRLYQQWQGLADQAAQQRGQGGVQTAGVQLAMQLKEWQLAHASQVALKGDRLAVGASEAAQAVAQGPHAHDPANSMLFALLNEAVRTMSSSRPERERRQDDATGARRRSSCDDDGRENSNATTGPRSSFTGAFYNLGLGDDLEEEGGGGGGQTTSAVEALFRHVLSMQEQLQQLDAENAQVNGGEFHSVCL